MTQKLNHRQKRGLLIILGALVLVVGWRLRAGYLANSVPEQVTDAPASPTAGSPTLVELNAADTTALQTVKGIGPAIARRIVRYRALIGGFTSTNQLLKVYGITPENFIRIEEQVMVDTTTTAFAALKAGKYETNTSFHAGPRSRNPYHQAADRRQWQRFDTQAQAPRDWNAPSQVAAAADAPTPTSISATPAAKTQVPAKVLDINQADSLDLVMISGIGPATARNILKYRSLIWFFDSIDQLAEVWGVRPENLDRMKPYLSVGDAKQKMPHIEINVMTVDEMGRHKYLGFKEAKILVAYREMHGPFVDFAAVQKVQGIPTEKLDKLRPYFLY